jgi:cytochrome b pre-mRNA-processing protein 3
LGLINRLFGQTPPAPTAALYAAIVERARAPHWYVEGAVPDTIDGRFDMVATILAVVLLRLEADPGGGEPGARLTEVFVADMDAQLREIGIGDVVVGKHVGKMMGALGGRLGAYRDALAGGDLREALVRNLYRGHAPSDAALIHTAAALDSFRDALARVPAETLIAGTLP